MIYVLLYLKGLKAMRCPSWVSYLKGSTVTWCLSHLKGMKVLICVSYLKGLKTMWYLSYFKGLKVLWWPSYLKVMWDLSLSEKFESYVMFVLSERSESYVISILIWKVWKLCTPCSRYWSAENVRHQSPVCRLSLLSVITDHWSILNIVWMAKHKNTVRLITYYCIWVFLTF